MKTYKQKYLELIKNQSNIVKEYYVVHDELVDLQGKINEQGLLTAVQAENIKRKYAAAVEALKMIKTIETSMRVEAFQKAGDLEAPQSVSLAEAIAEGVLSDLGELDGV